MLDEVIDYFGYNKLFIYENNDDRQVSNQGIALVTELLGINGFPSKFPRNLVTSQGKFASRVDKWARGFLGKKLSAKELEKIGKIADTYSMASDISYLDFYPGVMRWWKEGVKNGVFRTSGSCYYGGEGRSIPRLESLDTISLRLFQPGGGPGRNFHGHYTGLGRAWLTPYKDTVVASNMYLGPDGTKIIAPLLSNVFGIALGTEVLYKKVRFSVYGVYINNDSGHVFYRNGDSPPAEVRLEAKSVGGGGKCRCGTPLYWTDDGGRICSNCGAKCGKCGNEYEYFGMKYITDVDKWYCDSCSRNTSSCKCGRVYARVQKCSCELE